MANIRTAGKSGFIRRSGGTRRESLWVGVAASSTTLVALTPVLFAGLSATILGLRPFTIVRTRGHISLSTDQVSASESQSAAMGFAVVSDQAFAVGVTAVPTPITDIDSDLFFVYESMVNNFLFGSAIGFQAGSGVHRTFDSKAMRKVEEGQDVAITVESDTSPFSGSIVQKVGRMLIKLH